MNIIQDVIYLVPYKRTTRYEYVQSSILKRHKRMLPKNCKGGIIYVHLFNTLIFSMLTYVLKHLQRYAPARTADAHFSGNPSVQ